jgi:competence protein ComEA
MGEARRATGRQQWLAGIALVLAIAAFAMMTTRPVNAPPVASIVPVNLNRANQAELQLLPGIGPAIAGRIVSERESGGEFREVRDLARVSGVGERTVRNLQEFATVGD